MIVRSKALWATCAAIAAAAMFDAGAAFAQGLAAWDFEHGNPKYNGVAGNRTLGANAAGGGVGNPLGFKESTVPLTAGPPGRYNAAVEYARGYQDFNLGKFSQAREEFLHVIAADPRNSKALFMYGESLVGLGDVRGAAEAFSRAIRLDPDQITIRTEYAVALARIGDADNAQAQFAVLKARADACASACAQASELQGALARVHSAMTIRPNA